MRKSIKNINNKRKKSTKSIKNKLKYKKRNTSHNNFRKTRKVRFFNGGVYPGPPYEKFDTRLDPQREALDSRQLPDMQGGKQKQKKQKGGFYGVDLMKSLSYINPYPLANPTGLTGLPSGQRLLSNNSITDGSNTSYKEKYLV